MPHRPKYLRRHVLAASLALTLAAPAPAAELDEPIKPIPLTVSVNAKQAELGRKLFADKRFSRDGTVSCATCHDWTLGGADGKVRSLGMGGKEHVVNAPTVWNSGLNFRQLWSGAAASLEEVVDRVVKSPVVFDSKWEVVLGKFGQDAALVAAFKEAYGETPNPKNVSHALGEYQRSLITPNSRFDKYLRGDANALDASEVKGYTLFKNYGCIACHQGMGVGGNMYQTFGVMGDYFQIRGNVKPPDLGRFNATKRDTDKHVFKVPSLRNVALTAPYFHDGSAKTLEDAVDVMFKFQLGRTAPKEEKALIIRFLASLTGEIPKNAP